MVLSFADNQDTHGLEYKLYDVLYDNDAIVYHLNLEKD